MTGNDGQTGKHSCGYYDKEEYDKYVAKQVYYGLDSPEYLKLTKFHVGVLITKNRRYIEDKFVK